MKHLKSLDWNSLIATCLFLLIGFCSCSQRAQEDTFLVQGRWAQERINQWYNQQPWLVGCNYYPHTAINQIDMWQASTWDPVTIDLELSWAADIGMNTLRVYLHDLVWEDDEKGLYERMDQFLDICQKYDIRPFFVFFDDCHFPNPKLGKQPLPVKGYHNPGWVNSPARDVALRYADGKATEAEKQRLKGYVQQTMERFRDDPRVLMWELYNEPGRGTLLEGDFGQDTTLQAHIGEKSNKLVCDSWVWAREIAPSQPITSSTEGSIGEQNIAINRINSDLFSIHSYGGPDYLRKQVKDYRKDGRPVMVTEWLARGRGSTVEDCLPVMKELNVGAINWGFVSGKTGTVWPWASRYDSAKRRLSAKALRESGHVVQSGEPFPEPEVWHHDLFRQDGTPYDQKEIELFKKLTSNR